MTYMSMRRASDIFGARAVFESKYCLCNHLASVWSDDVCAKDAVSLRLSQNLDEALGVEVGLCARVRREAEFADLVLDALRLELLLSLADPGHLWVRVDNGGDGGVVNMTMTTLDKLDSSDT